jgi:hypothetical protein
MPKLTEDAFKEAYKTVAVRFYMHPEGKLNKRASEEQGYPVYDDVEKVEIRQAGDVSDWRDEFTNRTITYAELFSKQYRQFKENAAQIGEGTRIEVLPDLTPAQVSQLRALGCHTIQALAKMDGPELKVLGMFGREMKEKAEKFLERTNTFADASETRAELDALKEENAKLRALMETGKPPKERTKQGKTMKSGHVKQPTPFDDWTMDTIRVYLTENGVTPDRSHTKAKLIEEAMKVADSNQKANEAA